MKNETVNIEMSLISKYVNIKKICKTEREVFTFKRDMPSKYDLVFYRTPYVIGERNLDI